ncbi:MAG: hypothetical protein WC756_19435 [Taibaiella sp.]|jgi:hypothetical protein
MDIALLQKQICKVITSIGGHIRYKKELGLPARVYYFISRKEPVINIEALFLGERFGVIINDNKGHKNRNMFNSSGYRIIICSSLTDFKEQFNQLKEEKLNASE